LPSFSQIKIGGCFSSYVNTFPNVTTLAVGDGTNDVNMITAAHIGIRIKRVEENQTATTFRVYF